jgi:hypothetical protein
MHIRTYALPCAFIHEHTKYVHTVFKADQSECVFAPTKDQAFADAAREMGYGCIENGLMRYAVEHELAHHVSALERGLTHSLVAWAAAHNSWSSFDGAEWPMRAQDEEHLANRLQRFMNLGLEDQEGCLRGVYGKRLAEVAEKLAFYSGML